MSRALYTAGLVVGIAGSLAVTQVACPAPPPPRRAAPPAARPADRPREAARPAPAARRLPPRPLVAWRARPPKPGPTPPIVTPEVEAHRLPNGLTVLLVRRPGLPLVALRVVLRAGGYEDPAEKPGVASLTADLLNEGVKGLSALALSDRAAQLGATLGTSADADGSYVTIGVLRRHLVAAMDLVSRVLQQPTFPAGELARRQRQTTAYVQRVLHHPKGMAAIAFGRALFGAAHPYGRLDTGLPGDIARITRADVVAYHKTHYRPDLAALVVVGDVDWKALRPLLTRTLGRWRAPRGAAPGAATLPARPADGRLFVVARPGAPQSELRIGHLGPARKTPDMVPLLVMNTILGGSFLSRINLNLRERHGWTYGAYSGFAFDRRESPFKVSTAVQSSATVPAVREILGELTRMATGKVTPAEMRLAGQFLAISVSGWFVTNRGVAGAVGRLFLHGLPLDFWKTFPDKVRAVTPAEVARVARAHLQPGKAKVVIVGDPAVFAKDLPSLGLGKPVPVTP